jgi:hypothetical protein
LKSALPFTQLFRPAFPFKIAFTYPFNGLSIPKYPMAYSVPTR